MRLVRQSGPSVRDCFKSFVDWRCSSILRHHKCLSGLSCLHHHHHRSSGYVIVDGRVTCYE
jgi:mannose-6-phosphate isomerase-like protein (cupin superfamily)